MDSLQKGITLFARYSQKDDNNALIALNLDNLIAYVKIGTATYKYSKTVRVGYSEFYSSDANYETIKIDSARTILAKDSEFLDVTFLTIANDPIKVGEFIYTPLEAQRIGVFRNNVTSSEIV